MITISVLFENVTVSNMLKNVTKTKQNSDDQNLIKAGTVILLETEHITARLHVLLTFSLCYVSKWDGCWSGINSSKYLKPCCSLCLVVNKIGVEQNAPGEIYQNFLNWGLAFGSFLCNKWTWLFFFPNMCHLTSTLNLDTNKYFR